MNNKNINKFVVYKNRDNDISFYYCGISFRLVITGQWGKTKIAHLYFTKNEADGYECLKVYQLKDRYSPYLSSTFNLANRKQRVIVKEETIKKKLDVYDVELWEACKNVIG